MSQGSSLIYVLDKNEEVTEAESPLLVRDVTDFHQSPHLRHGAYFVICGT